MKNFQLTNKSMDDIVFEDRNKSYGAYVLRKLYDKNVLTGLAISVTAFTVLFVAILSKNFIDKEQVKEDKVVEVTMDMVDLPDVMPEITPPPPPPPPPPPAAKKAPDIKSVKFVPPKVVPDDMVEEEEVPPTIDEMEDAAISDKTLDGDSIDVNPIEHTDGVEGGVIGGEESDDMEAPVSFDASYPGGKEAFGKCIQQKIQYTSLAIRNEIEGVVYVSFTITPEGKLANIHVKKGLPGYGLDEEAIKAVEECGFGWQPAMQNGRRIARSMIIPVKFTLPDRY
ncbi:TonB family protein [Cytophagaceae bacterium ABcell3]|nr:TonB family protein [Cytophagaceae bacterium ABcell3]